MAHIPYSHKRRTPAPPRTSPEGQTKEARQRRKEEFEREEDPADDLGRMLLKLGRRLFTHQTHVIHRFNDYRGMLQKRLLVRALDNDEERYEFLMERLETNRLRSREYLSKAVALGVDQLSAWMEVQRGFFDELLDRADRHQAAERKQAQLMDRLLGLKEDDVHQASLRSMILFEKVRSLVNDSDPLMPKLSDDEHRELLEYALGQREAPELLHGLLRQAPQSRKKTSRNEGPSPREEEMQRYPLDLGVIEVTTLEKLNDNPRFARDPVAPIPFALTSNALDDQTLAFFIGPCVSMAHPELWAKVKLPWPDARLEKAPLALKPTGAQDVDTGPRLQVLGKVEGTIQVEWTYWFYQHFEMVREHLEEQKAQLRESAGDKQSAELLKTLADPALWKELHYAVDIHVPTVGTVMRLRFRVKWPEVKQ